MTELQKKKETVKTEKLRTIHSCLLALGASKKEIYANPNNTKKQRISTGRTYSIYQYYSVEELIAMVNRLYRHSVKRYHPDTHNGSYGKKIIRLNEAKRKAMKILSYH